MGCWRVAGEQISEQNIMRHVELIERRAIEIIAEYARSLDGKTRGIQRRPSALLVSRIEHLQSIFYLPKGCRHYDSH